MKIKRYQFNAKVFVSIIDQHDCPIDPYVSAYVNHLGAYVSVNTMLRSANELVFVLKHFVGNNIDLILRVMRGQLITEREYMQFYDRCCLNSEWADCSHAAVFKDITGKTFRNMLAANSRITARVSSATLQGRLRRLRNFIEWLSEQSQDVYATDEARLKLTGLISRIRVDERGLKNRGFSNHASVNSVIPDNVFNRLQSIIRPSALDNPFQKSKLRNYLIVSILMQSGIRRGAIAKLKISDFHFSRNYDTFEVYRSSNDTTDPRLDRPNQKTRAHFATVETALMMDVKHYIDTIRAGISGSCLHDFVFVTETNARNTLGNPISLKSINSIFNKISKVLRFRIHPHLLRHKWNEIYDRKAAQLGLDYRLIEDIRKYAMGWSQNTNMNQLYNDSRLGEKAREISKCHQERIDRQ